MVDTIAGQRWTDDEIPGLLLQLSAAMTDEVEAVARLDDQPALTAGGPRYDGYELTSARAPWVTAKDPRRRRARV